MKGDTATIWDLSAHQAEVLVRMLLASPERLEWMRGGRWTTRDLAERALEHDLDVYPMPEWYVTIGTIRSLLSMELIHGEGNQDAHHPRFLTELGERLARFALVVMGPGEFEATYAWGRIGFLRWLHGTEELPRFVGTAGGPRAKGKS